MSLPSISSPIFLRQCVGIDIGSSVCSSALGQEQADREIRLSKPLDFSNEESGFEAMIQWLEEQDVDPKDCQFVMEATGVYYEALALWLYEKGYRVAVLLANTVSAFSQSLNKKSKNDGIDARTLAQMGAERNLDDWQPAPAAYKTLKQLTRHRQKLTHQRTMAKNQLHAAKKEAPCSQTVIESYQALIDCLNKQIKAMAKEIQKLIASEPDMKKKNTWLRSIPTFGPVLASVLLAETQGFTHFRNQKQLVSYAGYDVIQRQSGSSINFRERISKKGNVHIRRALFMPSINVAKHIPEFARLYHKINQHNPQTKMKGAVAMQRKLLVLAYHLVKREEQYDPDKKK